MVPCFVQHVFEFRQNIVCIAVDPSLSVIPNRSPSSFFIAQLKTKESNVPPVVLPTLDVRATSAFLGEMGWKVAVDLKNYEKLNELVALPGKNDILSLVTSSVAAYFDEVADTLHCVTRLIGRLAAAKEGFVFNHNSSNHSLS